MYTPFQATRLAFQTVATRNVYGDTPLHLACYGGRLDATKTLIAAAGSHLMVSVRFISFISPWTQSYVQV